jgi:hypothetical protein
MTISNGPGKGFNNGGRKDSKRLWATGVEDELREGG